MVRTTNATEIPKDEEKSNNDKKNNDHKDFSSEVKEKFEWGVEYVKEKFHEWEEMFSEEIWHVKDTAKKTGRNLEKSANSLTNWFSKNRHTVVWVILLAIGLYRLATIVIGLLFVIAWVLFITWYFNDKMNNKK